MLKSFTSTITTAKKCSTSSHARLGKYYENINPQARTITTSINNGRPSIQDRNLVLRQFGTTSWKPKPSPKSSLIVPPTSEQLRIVAIRAAIPMVGFGFIDNLVMIQAGEAIDMSLGVTFGLSTMTAAGFGQVISDVAGTTSGGLVDNAVSKMNLPHHKLSQTQLMLKQSRVYSTLGGCVGVVVGCLLGMSCILFMDTERADRAKKAKELKSIFETVMERGHVLLNAERCTLWLLNEESEELWSSVTTVGASSKKLELRISASTGVVGYSVQNGELVNIQDAYEDARFHKDVDKDTGYRTRSILVVPIKDQDEKVIGAIQMINKKNGDGTDGVFDENDTKMTKMLSSHVSAFIRVVHG